MSTSRRTWNAKTIGVLLTTLLVIVAIATGALALVACGGGSLSPSSTPSVSGTGSSSSSSASPSPSSSATVTAKQSVIAVASGPQANGLSAVSQTGQVKLLLAPTGGSISAITWSPDGNTVAFLQARTGDDSIVHLWVFDPQKELLVEVGAGVSPYTVESYAWVGPTTIMESYFPSGATTYHANGTLYRFDLETSSGTPVEDASSTPLKGVGLSASADGVKVAFVSYGATTPDAIAESLLVLRTDDLSVTTVAEDEAPTDMDGDAFTYPVISPDGTLVYTVGTGTDPSFGCRVFNLDGSKALEAYYLVWPTPGAWSSSGRLAFGGGKAVEGVGSGTIQLWQARTATPTAILPLMKHPVGSLAWSPTATQIAFSLMTVYGEQGSLWVVNADGSNRHLLLAKGSWPAWAMAPISFP